MLMAIPEVRKTPCFDCPWRRESAAGWLGPNTAEEWEALAHSDAIIACHITIDETSGVYGNQCAGVAIYRSNICKSPRDPQIVILPADKDTVFGYGEFVKYHNHE